MADRSAQDLTGQRLGHFRVDGVIGRGGMSVLYRATDTRLGRRVALKVIDEALAADREFRERFVDEARNTSAVDHSHVVPLYDFDETDGHLYIAMRHVEGPDLASVIDNRPVAVARTLRLLGQVADALDAVHARGLVHLDVKPANVLVTTRESAGEHVYLADFGLTRRGATGHRTSGGDFLGSPTYAAPEHLRGEPVDARTDVYSLTCVLFTCLTGRAPYLGSVTEVIDGHLAGELPSIADLVGLDPRIDDVVRRGMDPDRPRRHESASAVIEAARGALTGPGPMPLVGPPPTRRPAAPSRHPGRAVPPVAAVGPVGPVRPVPPVGRVAPVAMPAARDSGPEPARNAPAASATESSPPASASAPASGDAAATGSAAPGSAVAGSTAEAAAAATSAGTDASAPRSATPGSAAPGSAAPGSATPGSTAPGSVPPGAAAAGSAPAAPASPNGVQPPRGPSGSFAGRPHPPPTPPRGGPPVPPGRPPGPPSGPFSAPGPSGAPPPGPLTRSSVAPPMRLRDPMPPDRDGSFVRAAGDRPKPLVLVVGGVVVLAVIVLLVLLIF